MDNQKKPSTYGTQDKDKQTKNKNTQQHMCWTILCASTRK